jgi:hypothetical protein
MRRFLIGCAVALLAVGVSSVPARADAPRDQGWWTVTTPGATPLPAQLPAQPPGPPDVPARGLLIQAGAGNTMPSAYAALLYELDQGTTAGKLTLAVAPNTLTTPMATLQLCQLLQPINHPEQGGPIADAPPFNCGKSAKAAPSADGKTYTFDAGGLVSDNLLAVAILPTGPTDRVVFNAPDASSLATQAGDSSGGPAPSDSAAVAAPSDSAAAPAPLDTSGLAGGGASPSLADSVPGAVAAGPSSVSPAPAATPPRSTGDAGVFVPTVGTGAEPATPILVILFIVGLLGGTVLWLFAGRQRPTVVIG